MSKEELILNNNGTRLIRKIRQEKITVQSRKSYIVLYNVKEQDNSSITFENSQFYQAPKDIISLEHINAISNIPIIEKGLSIQIDNDLTGEDQKS